MSNEKIQAELDKYESVVAKAIAKFPERANLPEQRLYTPLDIAGADEYVEKLGFPGEYPFSRPCTAVVSGRCVCMPDSPRRRLPTSVIAI